MATSTISLRANAPKISEKLPTDSLPLEEQIRQRAHQIWLLNGSLVGSDVTDWLEAEQQILHELE